MYELWKLDTKHVDVLNIKQENPIVFSGDERPSEVNNCQIMNTL